MSTKPNRAEGLRREDLKNDKDQRNKKRKCFLQ